MCSEPFSCKIAGGQMEHGNAFNGSVALKHLTAASILYVRYYLNG